MSNQVHGFLVDRLIIEARKWIPDDATYKDIEDYVYHGCKGADVEIFTVSPGAADIYQVEQAASLFDVGLTAADRDYDFGWEAVEAKACEIADALKARMGDFTTDTAPGVLQRNALKDAINMVASLKKMKDEVEAKKAK